MSSLMEVFAKHSDDWYYFTFERTLFDSIATYLTNKKYWLIFVETLSKLVSKQEGNCIYLISIHNIDIPNENSNNNLNYISLHI